MKSSSSCLISSSASANLIHVKRNCASPSKRLAKNLDHGKQSDINLLDFAKAFDTVPHQGLLLKLSHYGVQDTITKWIQA